MIKNNPPAVYRSIIPNGIMQDLKTDYQYLIFVEVPNPGRKTSVWECRNKNSQTVLGTVSWYGPWRQYCYFPSIQAVYSAGCLQDITHFINQLKYR